MVGNLGSYQIMTILAKKVGGPANLGGIIALFGSLGGGCFAYKHRDKIEHFMTNVKGKLAIPSSIKELQEESHIYRCHTDCEISMELRLKQNDEFIVLYADDEMVLINVVGDNNSPYIVDKNKLEDISGYKK